MEGRHSRLFNETQDSKHKSESSTKEIQNNPPSIPPEIAVTEAMVEFSKKVSGPLRYDTVTRRHYFLIENDIHHEKATDLELDSQVNSKTLAPKIS